MKKQTKTEQKNAIVNAGRKALALWLTQAEEHGTIYYNIDSVSRSGMSRRIVLSTIIIGIDGKPFLSRLWPRVSDDMLTGSGSNELDIVAKDWGFDFTGRSFKVYGGGMDMVFALIDSLAKKAGLDSVRTPGGKCYANRVNWESF